MNVVGTVVFVVGMLTLPPLALIWWDQRRTKKKAQRELCQAIQARIWERIENHLVAAEFEKWARNTMVDELERRPEESEAVIVAVTEALKNGKTPLSVEVHWHPSGPVVDVLCAEDAAERAEEILSGLGETA